MAVPHPPPPPYNSCTLYSLFFSHFIDFSSINFHYTPGLFVIFWLPFFSFSTCILTSLAFLFFISQYFLFIDCVIQKFPTLTQMRGARFFGHLLCDSVEHNFPTLTQMRRARFIGHLPHDSVIPLYIMFPRSLTLGGLEFSDIYPGIRENCVSQNYGVNVTKIESSSFQ